MRIFMFAPAVASLFASAFDYYADRAPKGEAHTYEFDGARIIKVPYRFNILNRLRSFSSLSFFRRSGLGTAVSKK